MCDVSDLADEILERVSELADDGDVEALEWVLEATRVGAPPRYYILKDPTRETRLIGPFDSMIMAALSINGSPERDRRCWMIVEPEDPNAILD